MGQLLQRFLLFLVVSNLCHCIGLRRRGNGLSNVEISTEIIASVRFGQTKLAVWQDAVKPEKFYVLPLGHLKPETAEASYNMLTKVWSLVFSVQLWSEEDQKVVFERLKKDGKSVKKDNIQMMPIDSIRLIDSWDEIVEEFSISSSWKTNSNQPDEMDFQIDCADEASCQELQQSMKHHPELFQNMELQFRMLTQNTAGRKMVVTGSDIQSGELFTKLKNMPGAEGDERFLSSEDMKQLTAESVSVASASVRVDANYQYSEGDTVQLTESLEKVLTKNKVKSDQFESIKWDSVFWNDDWSRPDKITQELNTIYSLDKDHKDHLKVDEDAYSAYVKTSAGGSFAGVSASMEAETGASYETKTTVQDVVDTLEENNLNSEWDGEKFVEKPLDLYRMNLNDYKTTSTIEALDVQVQEIVGEYTIPLTVPKKDDNRESALTLFLMRQRVEVALENLKKEVSKNNTVLSDLEVKRANEVKNSVKTLIENPSWPTGAYCIFQSPKKVSLTTGYNASESCPDGFDREVGGFHVKGSPKADDDDYNHIDFLTGGSKSTKMSIRTCCKWMKSE